MKDKYVVIYKIDVIGEYVAAIGSDFKTLTDNFFTGSDDIKRVLVGSFEPWSFCKVTMYVGKGKPYIKKPVWGTAHLLQMIYDPNFRGIARVDEETLGNIDAKLSGLKYYEEELSQKAAIISEAITKMKRMYDEMNRPTIGISTRGKYDYTTEYSGLTAIADTTHDILNKRFLAKDDK